MCIFSILQCILYPDVYRVKVHHRADISPPVGAILSRLNPVHTFSFIHEAYAALEANTFPASQIFLSFT
jgi:hypothetical protein